MTPATRTRSGPAVLEAPTKAPEAPPVAKRPLVTPVRLAVAGLAVLCALSWWWYGGTRSPWIRLAHPGGIHADFPVTGYTSLYNGDFYHKENFYALQHLDLIKGNYASFVQRIGFCDRRIFFAVSANLFTVVFNSYYALWALNLVVYWCCALLVARTTGVLFADRTKSLLASALFATSVAATVHVGDLSPHFLGIGCFYLWALLLLRAEVNDAPITWRWTIGLSALLGVWSLTYTSAAFGLGIVVLFLLKHRKLLHVALPALAWYAAPRMQQEIIQYLGFGIPLDVETNLAWRGLEKHVMFLSADPLNYCGFLAVEFANYLFNDNPLNVVIAVAGLLFVRHKAKWLLWVLYFLPIAIAFIFVPTTTARGYAVAGNTIVLFAMVSHLAVETSRRVRAEFGRKAAVLTIVTLLAVQAAWGHSSLVNWLYPTGAYAMGIFKHAGIVVPAEFARMTGPAGAAPTIRGGTVTAAESCGLPDGFGRQPILVEQRLDWHNQGRSGVRRIVAGLGVQAPVVGCLLIAALALLRWRWTLSLGPIFAAWIAMAQIFGSATGVDTPSLRSFDDPIRIEEQEKLTVRIQLSDEFREKLTRAASANVNVELFTRLQPLDGSIARPFQFQVFEWTSDAQRFRVPATAFLAALKANRGRVEFSIIPQPGSKGLLVHSWQALRAAEGKSLVDHESTDRAAFVVRADATRVLIAWFPTFEVRVIRGENAYPFQAWTEQFTTAQPMGYVLVGY